MRVATAPPAAARPRAWAPAAAPHRQARYHHPLGKLAQSLSRRLGSGALVWDGPDFCPWWASAWLPHDSDRQFLLQDGSLGAIAVVQLSDQRFYPSHSQLADLTSFIVQHNRELSLNAIGRRTNAD